MRQAQAEIQDAKNRLRHVSQEEANILSLNEQKMKNYFKKTNIYKKYLVEQNEEKRDDADFAKTDNELNYMKKKMDNLQNGYHKL